ncbi:MAG: hypothetical protein WC325_10360 [Candidatus Bathyarchaeia archaeon]|jgi:hypothetical protein
MSEKYDRQTRIYILAKACTYNNLTPDSPTYHGFIIKVCASKFGLSHDSANEHAETLTSAYRGDKWQSIIGGSTTQTETTTQAPYTSDKVVHNTPCLNTLKSFNLKGPSEPIKKIQPKPYITEAEDTPANTAKILINLAHQNIWDGKGRLTLAEARYELSDKTLTLPDLKLLINQYYPAVTVEFRPGNMMLFDFNGRVKRSVVKVVQEAAPVFTASKNEYFLEAPLETDATEYSDDEADIAEE